MLKINFLVVSLMLLGCGCSILPTPPEVPVHYFDIGFPKPMEKSEVSVMITPFVTSGPYNARMVFRNSANSIEFDEFNRWSDSPAELLQRYFTLALGAGKVQKKDSKQLVLSGELLRFDGDLTNNTANLILAISIRDKDGKEPISRHIFREKVSVTEVTASGYAKGMEQAVGKIVTAVKAKIRKQK